MISVEEWAEIRRLHRAEGMPIKAIVRHLGLARNTVRDAIGSEEPRLRWVCLGPIPDDLVSCSLAKGSFCRLSGARSVRANRRSGQ